MDSAKTDSSASNRVPAAPLNYAEDCGNEAWNDVTPTAKWKAYAIDAQEVHLPYLCDMAMHVGGFIFYAHTLVVASGAGAMSQRSIGAVIFGGLLVATVLSLFVVPAFFVLMKKLEANWFPASHEQQEPLPQP